VAGLAHAALVLTHVVELVASHREIGLRVAVPRENLPSFLLALLHSSFFLFAFILVDEAFLCCCFGHFKVLLWQVGFSQLVDEFEAAFPGLRIEVSAVVLEVILVLGKAFERAVAEGPISFDRVAFHGLLWVPFLTLRLRI